MSRHIVLHETTRAPSDGLIAMATFSLSATFSLATFSKLKIICSVKEKKKRKTE